MGGRFPNVDWYCDNCDEPLNEQAGFDDDNETWACTECGHANTISSEEIIPESVMEEAAKFLANFDPDNYR